MNQGLRGYDNAMRLVYRVNPFLVHAKSVAFSEGSNNLESGMCQPWGPMWALLRPKLVYSVLVVCVCPATTKGHSLVMSKKRRKSGRRAIQPTHKATRSGRLFIVSCCDIRLWHRQPPYHIPGVSVGGMIRAVSCTMREASPGKLLGLVLWEIEFHWSYANGPELEFEFLFCLHTHGFASHVCDNEAPCYDRSLAASLSSIDLETLQLLQS